MVGSNLINHFRQQLNEINRVSNACGSRCSWSEMEVIFSGKISMVRRFMLAKVFHSNEKAISRDLHLYDRIILHIECVSLRAICKPSGENYFNFFLTLSELLEFIESFFGTKKKQRLKYLFNSIFEFRKWFTFEYAYCTYHYNQST